MSAYRRTWPNVCIRATARRARNDRPGHEAGALGREGDGGFQVRNNVRADTAPAGRFGCYRTPSGHSLTVAQYREKWSLPTRATPPVTRSDRQRDCRHTRGMPRPRSATMLRWISFVPPAIVPENALRKSNIGLPNGSSASMANAWPSTPPIRTMKEQIRWRNTVDGKLDDRRQDAGRCVGRFALLQHAPQQAPCRLHLRQETHELTMELRIPQPSRAGLQ